jgi:hypothetical protein
VFRTSQLLQIIRIGHVQRVLVAECGSWRAEGVPFAFYVRWYLVLCVIWPGGYLQPPAASRKIPHLTEIAVPVPATARVSSPNTHAHKCTCTCGVLFGELAKMHAGSSFYLGGAPPSPSLPLPPRVLCQTQASSTSTDVFRAQRPFPHPLYLLFHWALGSVLLKHTGPIRPNETRNKPGLVLAVLALATTVVLELLTN